MPVNGKASESLNDPNAPSPPRLRRVFIVEDNLENRIITRFALATTPLELEFDVRGHDTVRRLRQFAPVDLILLDLMLPRGANGLDIYREIQKAPELVNIPCAAVSAADPAEAMATCRSLGLHGFIAKPIDDELFPKQILQLIAGEQVWYTGR